jgi:hypothetical protein
MKIFQAATIPLAGTTMLAAKIIVDNNIEVN